MSVTESRSDDRLRVKVIRSARRKKSSSARVVDGVIEVRVPSWMSGAEERDAVDALVRRIEKKRAVSRTEVDLVDRCARIAKAYGLPRPTEVRWVTNQNTLWGSCSYEAGVIRISARLARVPMWVLDYVLLHELTHLVEPGHGPRFHELMARYPKAERAEGFLDAMALGCADARFSV